jgi:hypothetical protein
MNDIADDKIALQFKRFECLSLRKEGSHAGA